MCKYTQHYVIASQCSAWSLCQANTLGHSTETRVQGYPPACGLLTLQGGCDFFSSSNPWGIWVLAWHGGEKIFIGRPLVLCGVVPQAQASLRKPGRRPSLITEDWSAGLMHVLCSGAVWG